MLEQEPQGWQYIRLVTQIIFSGLELAPSQQPPESKASKEHSLLHLEVTIPSHLHTSNDLDIPTITQEQVTSRESLGQVAGTVHKQA
jgi:hypothetical protein